MWSVDENAFYCTCLYLYCIIGNLRPKCTNILFHCNLKRAALSHVDNFVLTSNITSHIHLFLPQTFDKIMKRSTGCQQRLKQYPVRLKGTKPLRSSQSA